MNFVELEAAAAVGGILHRPLLKETQKEAKPYLDQIHRLATSFVGVGLGHLSAERSLLDVSEGESRRLRLAAVFDGRHHSLCLLLDEPARGLHDEDVERLAATLRSLRGPHTLILNEHRRRLARAADHLVELGPGPGPHGGRIVSSGPVPRTWWTENSDLERSPLSIDQRTPQLEIKDCRINNLQGIDVKIPLGRMVCITGVSGSGKSSFVRGVLVPALSTMLAADFEDFEVRHGKWSKVVGVKAVKGLVALDQRMAAPNRRSTVATFLELADPLRQHFAKQPAAKAAGLRATDFGFNAGDGRCQCCFGIGEVEDGDRWVICPVCAGRRLGPAALSVRDEHGNLAQLLETPISELRIDHESPLTAFASLLQTVDELGVGHLSLGRRLDTISGGELQRLRIARELATHDRGGLMFVFDEPAAGLHHEDVKRLLAALDRIVGGGHNSLVIVEHNLDLVSVADWVIEFGPGSGPTGGKVVAAGPPAKILGTDTATGRMLSSTRAQPKLGKVKTVPRSIRAANVGDSTKVLRWLRRLLGDDVPPSSSEDSNEVLCPTVALSPGELALLRPLDFGGLDRELAALILDLEATGVPSPTSMINSWSDEPNAHLRIHPLIHDMYVWGLRVPDSVQRERKRGQIALGLKWDAAQGIADLRATSPRFELPDTAKDGERASVIEDALVLGGGFVELQLGRKTLTRLQTRALDLDAGIVGPMRHSPLDMIHRDERGRCPTCAGTGDVAKYPERLIVGDDRRAVEDQAFLTPHALEVLRGVHRSVVAPFFKRMIKEGLWTAKVPLRRLSADDRVILFHGYWCRPGPGSFLKTPKANPSEVSSWLRWDGLHVEIRRNAGRGDEGWQREINESVEHVSCPSCGGMGLRRHVELIDFDGRSYADWLRRGTVGELYDAVRRVSAPSRRVERRRESLLKVLGAIGKPLHDLRLRATLPEDKSLELARAVVAVYTDMPVIEVP